MTDYIRNRMGPEQYYMEHLHDFFDEEIHRPNENQRFFSAVYQRKFKVWLLQKHGMDILTDDEIQFVNQEAYDTFTYEVEKLHTLRMLQSG